MGSLVFEQNCVVKFLTLEKNTTANIYKRLKKIYQQNVLPLDDVIRLYQNFSGLTLPVTESISNEDVRYIKIEPLDTSLTIEDIHEPHIQVFEETDSLSQTPMKKRQLISATSEIISTKPGRAKRKASLKAKDTWENLKPSHNKFKQEVLNVIENYEQQEESDEIEYQMDMDYSFKGDEEDIEQVEEEEDDTEYAKDFAMESIELPFLPQTDKYTPYEILEALQGTSMFCLLCDNRKFKNKFRLRSHLLSVHAKHYVRLESRLSLLCKKSCKGITTGHYHCPFCSHITNRDRRLFLHYHKHLVRRRVSLEQQIKLSKVRTNECICIDPKEGLFLVSKSLYVSDQPMHVIVNESDAQCSDDLCEQSMAAARDSGNPLLCKHVLRATDGQIEIAPEDCVFEDVYFDELNLFAEEKERCKNLVDYASIKAVPAVVRWIDDEEIHYYSIICDMPFGSFGRTFVKHDLSSNKFECTCPYPTDHFCPFKILSQIHRMVSP